MKLLHAMALVVVLGLISSVKASTYSDAVMSLSPVSYYQLNEAFPTTDANSDGVITVRDMNGNAAIDATGNTTGTYGVDVANYPGSSPEPGVAGPTYAGLGGSNTATWFYGGTNPEIQPDYDPETGEPAGADGVDGISVASSGQWDSAEMTYVCFFKVNSEQVGWGQTRMIVNESTAANDFKLMFDDTGSLVISADDQGIAGWDSNSQISDDTYLDDEWHMAVAVRTGNNGSVAQRKLYVDGVEVTTHTDFSYASMSKDSDGASRIGQRSVMTGWGGYQGGMDEIAVYDYALSASQIAELWTAANTGGENPYDTADFNQDRVVDVIDLGILAGGWQTDAGTTGGDANDDGIVDVIDLGILAGQWQHTTSAATTTTPEPATLSLLALGGLAIARRRRA